MKTAFLLGILFSIAMVIVVVYTIMCILRWGVKRETKRIIAEKKLDPKSERVMVEQLRILFHERCFGCRTRNRFHKPECPVALQLAKDWLEQDVGSNDEGSTS